MKIEAFIFMILVFGLCFGGFILSIYLSARENKPSKKRKKK